MRPSAIAIPSYLNMMHDGISCASFILMHLVVVDMIGESAGEHSPCCKRVVGAGGRFQGEGSAKQMLQLALPHTNRQFRDPADLPANHGGAMAAATAGLADDHLLWHALQSFARRSQQAAP